MNYTIENKTEQNEDSPIIASLITTAESTLTTTTHIVSQLMWDKNGELINE